MSTTVVATDLMSLCWSMACKHGKLYGTKWKLLCEFNYLCERIM